MVLETERRGEYQTSVCQTASAAMQIDIMTIEIMIIQECIRDVPLLELKYRKETQEFYTLYSIVQPVCAHCNVSLDLAVSKEKNA